MKVPIHNLLQSNTILLVLSAFVIQTALAEETRPLFKAYRFEDNNRELKKIEGPYLGSLKEILLQPKLKLDIGADLRLTSEWQFRPNFGTGINKSEVHWLQRYAVHLNLTGPDDWRVFSQFKYSKENGKRGTPTPLDNDNPDVQQLFVDKTIHLDGHEVLARVGRQEALVGSGRFISFRDGPNSRASFDGFRIIDDIGTRQVDLFTARPVIITPGPFDNKDDNTNLIISLYGARLLNQENYSLDVSLSYFEKKDAFYSGQKNEEDRYSIGSRFQTTGDLFKTDTDIIFQTGKFGKQNILAYGLTSESRWEFKKDEFFLLGKFSYFSGDHSQSDSKLNTFNSYYARASYYGWSNQLGHPNLIAVQPGFSYKINPMFLLITDYGMYWRQSSSDIIYAGTGMPIILPLANNDKKFIGSQVNSNLQISIGPLVTLAFEYSYFFHAGYVERYSDTQFFATRFLIKI